MFLLYHAYVYLEFLILACTIYILAPIRRLVPRECLRLQGFYDWQIDRIEQETSDSQLYKQAGNGVTVNVIEAIGTLLRQADTEIRAEDEKTKR